jgi:cytochrome b561
MSAPDSFAPKSPVPYPVPIRLLHWLSAGALLTVFSLALLHNTAAAESAQKLLISAHRWVGLGILLISGTRILFRIHHQLTAAAPEPVTPAGAPPSRLQQWAAFSVHGLLYVGLLAMPLCGWALSCAQGVSLSVGSITLPVWFDADPDLADTLEDIHDGLAYVLASLIGLHLVAVLWHQHWRRDGILTRMLPARRP